MLKPDVSAKIDQQTTCQRLALHARRQPEALAIVNGRYRSTYVDLAMNVLRIMEALTSDGIQARQIVGVDIAERHVHLQVLLACEALGATTISLAAAELDPPADLGRLCDRILVAGAAPRNQADKVLPITNDWLTHVLACPMDPRRLDALDHPSAPDAMVRLIKSSGTTGMPKVMGMTYRVQQRTLQKNLLHAAAQIGPHPVFLCFYNFSVRGSHSRTLLTLQLGGTVHFIGVSTAWDAIVAGIGTFALFIAGDLERFVRAVPANSSPADLHVDVIGSAISARLRQETREKLTRNLLVTYGTNEVHHISVVDANNVGTLFDDVRVMIADGAGMPLPFGQQGLICLKTETMTDGYIDAPDLTRATFVDGWYHTGDLGYQPSQETLVVLGRSDEMLNIGGVKIAPGPIEERLKTIDGVLDAVILGIADHLETNGLLVAVETEVGAGPTDLATRIASIITAYVMAYQVLNFSAFPRTESGKVRREAVHEAYRRAAGTT
jgi:acyl-coenzyme A synthetase/AMP-(fatty) acid ligase